MLPSKPLRPVRGYMEPMATDRQIEANRKNAEKSCGPRTSEGKAKVAMNALKHGLLAVRARRHASPRRLA